LLKSFFWRGFTISLLPITEARLSIFYADLIEDENKNKSILKIPSINKEILKSAIDELEVAFNTTQTAMNKTMDLLSSMSRRNVYETLLKTLSDETELDDEFDDN
jgi:hypothetical protein